MRGPHFESENTPTICQQIGALAYSSGRFDEAGMRPIKQLGADYVLTSEIRPPWEEGSLNEAIARVKSAGLTLRHMYLPGLKNAITGAAGRDEEIENAIRNIRVAGKAGVPVLEYNWYGHRAVEGYFGETARGRSAITSFDYARLRGLPALPPEDVHSTELWRTLTYFLKAAIPEAEKAGVRLAMHPNDPPAPLSRGSGRSWARWRGGSG